MKTTRPLFGIFSITAAFSLQVHAQTYTIVTVGGNGAYGYSGAGGLATNASLAHPRGVAVDTSGNVFIADSENGRIRKVNTSGIITTVAGNGTGGYSGDGGAATNASLNLPWGVAADASGNVFVADLYNNRIRKVGTNGIITTVAGNGTGGYSGDGGMATNASLKSPYGVAVDASGNLFIADDDNNRIRKVDTNGIITTVAGNGTGGYSGDGGPATNASLHNVICVAVDTSGNLFIPDLLNALIRKVDTNGIITTVAGNGTSGYSGDGGLATNASFNWPEGVAVDYFGNLFIADVNNHRIRKVGINGIITTVAGNGTGGYSGDGDTATNASLNFPSGVAVDTAGNLFIADGNNNRIRKLYPNQAGPCTPHAATATAVVAYGFVVAAPLTDGGCGYTNTPLVLFQGGGGTGAAATAVVSNGVVVNIIITSNGNYYTSPPTVLIGSKPVIGTQPQSVTVNAGDTASFTVTDVEFTPATYQWFLNGTNVTDSTYIWGANTSALTISNVTQSDLGAYTVVIANPFGSEASSDAILSMYPFLETPFAGAVTYWGTNATFSVTAGGSEPLSYQWFNNGVAIQDATNPVLNYASIQFTNAGTYWVVVSNSFGSVTNAPVQVVVNPAGVSLGLYPGVTISGVVGNNYVIQRTADLSNTNSWVTMANVTLTESVQLWVDTNVDASLPANPHHFYQVLPSQ